jgi:hypothetical protein
MTLRYPAHRVNAIEKYVAEGTTSAAAPIQIDLTDRTLVRLAFSNNDDLTLENGSEDGLYRVLIAESIVAGSTSRLQNGGNVKLKDRAWLPVTTGEVLGLMWNAALAQWIEVFRSITYDSYNGVYVKNDTGSIIARGRVVYINGINGNNPTIALASNTTELLSNRTLGLVKDDIPINGFGYVVSSGVIENINTVGGASGGSVYLGVTGAFTATKPVAPAHMVKVGNFLKINVATGSIQVDVSNGFELDELHDVLISGPTNGQVLTYDGASSLWKNAAGGGGSSPSIGGTITGGTAGSILFVDPAATIAQDNANLFWDNANNEMGIGINTPDETLHVHKATAGAVTSAANAVITLENSTSAFLQILNPAADEGGVLFGSPTSNVQGGVVYNHSTDILTLRTGGNSARLNIDGTGNVAIGKGTTAGTSRFNVGATDQFQVDSTGDIVKINNVITTFPAVQGAVNTYLKNDGAGTLTWSTVSGGSGLSEPEVMARTTWNCW